MTGIVRKMDIFYMAIPDLPIITTAHGIVAKERLFKSIISGNWYSIIPALVIMTTTVIIVC